MAGTDTSFGGLAERYASALFDLADSAKKLDVVADDFRALKGIIGESADLRRLLDSPIYSREQQTEAIQAILTKAGADDLTRRFALVTAENRRLFAFPAMIDAYLAELARRRGEVTAHVTAARALSEAEQTALAEALQKQVGGKINMDIKIDPSLLGGLVVRVGSRMIDSSIKNKLQRLKVAMKGVG